MDCQHFIVYRGKTLKFRCLGVLEYVYGCWWRCRFCGKWTAGW